MMVAVAYRVRCVWSAAEPLWQLASPKRSLSSTHTYVIVQCMVMVRRIALVRCRDGRVGFSCLLRVFSCIAPVSHTTPHI